MDGVPFEIARLRSGHSARSARQDVKLSMAERTKTRCVWLRARRGERAAMCTLGRHNRNACNSMRLCKVWVKEP